MHEKCSYPAPIPIAVTASAFQREVCHRRLRQMGFGGDTELAMFEGSSSLLPTKTEFSCHTGCTVDAP